VRAFVSLGHQIYLLVSDGQPAARGRVHDVAREDFAGATLVTFRDYGERLRPPGALRARASLRQVLASISPDVVHAHAVTRYGWLADLAGRHPFVVTPWGSDLLVTVPRSKLARFLARRALSRADLVTVDSPALGRAAITLGAAPARLRLIGFGVDPDRFQPGPPDYGLRHAWDVEGRRVIFSPRSLAPIYRQDVAIRALAELPADTVLVLTLHNADPATADALRALASELGVNDRIRWLLPIDHAAMPAAYRLAAIVLSIPESDSMPVTLWEAAACGRPVVASDLPDARALLEAVDPDAIVPIGGVAATASALRRALARPAVDEIEVGRHLRQLARDRGDQRKNLSRMDALYRALAAGDPLPGQDDEPPGR